MSSLSQFTGGGGSGPIGSVVMMHQDYPDDVVSDNGRTYLKTGVLTPYIADYSAFAALGYTSNNYPAALDYYNYNRGTTPGPSASTSHFIKMYGKGGWGTLTTISAGNSSAAGLIYAFNTSTNYASTPTIIKYPDELPSTDSVTTPTYSEILNLWCFAQIPSTSIGNTAATAFIILWTSENGTTWKKTLPISLSGAAGLLGSNQTNIAFSGANLCMTSRIDLGTVYTLWTISFIENFSNAVATIFTTSTSAPVGPAIRSVSATEAVVAWNSSGNATVNAYLCADKTFTSLYSWSNAGYSAGMFAYDIDPVTGTVVMLANTITYKGVGFKNLANQSLLVLPTTDTNGQAASVWWNGSYFITTGSTTSATPVYFRHIRWYNIGTNTWKGVTNNNTANAGMFFGEVGNYLKYYNGNSQSTSDTTVYRIQDLSLDAGVGLVTPLSRDNFISTALNPPGCYQQNNGVTLSIAIGSILTGLNKNTAVFYQNLVTPTIGDQCRFKYVNSTWFLCHNSSNILHYSSNGTTWNTVTITALGAQIFDIDYIAGTYVVVGALGTNNAAYSTDLAAWTGVTIVGGAGICIFNTGTALVALTTSGARRSTNGSTWSGTMTGATLPQVRTIDYFIDGSTSYIFSLSATSGVADKLVSVDNGASWTTTTIVVPRISGTTNATPYNFIKSGSITFCLMGSSYRNGTSTAVGVFTTTDFITFTEVRVFNAYAFSAPARLFVQDGVIQAECLNGANFKYMMVFGNGTTSFIGTQDAVSSTGQIGYIRIK